MAKLAIDVVSDVVCPWCFIGSKRLEQALATRPEVEVEVRYQPYLLDPSTPEGGGDLRAHLKKKYNVDPATMFSRVESAARGAGIALDFSKVRHYSNTLSAHVLIEIAAQHGKQREAVMALFDAYFLRGEDVGDRAVLRRVAGDLGLDAAATDEAVSSDFLRGEIREIAEVARRKGITGVPTFIFANKLAVTGAQDPATLLKVLDRALAL